MKDPNQDSRLHGQYSKLVSLDTTVKTTCALCCFETELHFDKIVGFEVFAAVTMKNTVVWDVAQSGSCKNQLFEGTCLSLLQGRRTN
jgi:hypothetical protein